MHTRESQNRSYGCQIRCLGSMSEPVKPREKIWLRLKRLRRYIRKGQIYLINWVFEVTGSRRVPSTLTPNSRSLEPGDLVRVRLREEIQTTLNRRNKLRGCGFMEEMSPYCGTTQRVLKQVKRFIDERDYKMKRGRGIVFLEGVICEGTKDFGPCDRACFFFWREEWLEKIEE